MTGAVVSRTVTVNEPVPVLPAASVAEQFTVVVPRANVDPDAFEQVTVGLVGFASLAVAVYVTTAPALLVASAVTSAGRLSCGGVVSQLTTFHDAARLPSRERVPPPFSAPEAVYFTEPLFAPVDEVAAAVNDTVLEREALIAPFVRLFQLEGSVTLDGAVAVNAPVTAALNETLAPFAKTWPPPRCSIAMRIVLDVVVLRQTSPNARAFEATGVKPSPSATTWSAASTLHGSAMVSIATKARAREKVLPITDESSSPQCCFLGTSQQRDGDHRAHWRYAKQEKYGKRYGSTAPYPEWSGEVRCGPERSIAAVEHLQQLVV
jgi:hypothetical protein